MLKLCDFGTAKKLEHTLTNAVGTIRYMAPEVIRGKEMLCMAGKGTSKLFAWLFQDGTTLIDVMCSVLVL